MALTLFAALAIPDDVADRLIAIQRGVPGARWRPRENLHLTLRYYGSVQEPVADEIDAGLEAIALRTRPFSVALNGAGAFGGAQPDALIIKAEASPALTKLAADCERAARQAGLRPETRKFTPHVTLAYLGVTELTRVQAFERANGLFQQRFEAREICLFSSWSKQNAPNLYRLEASYPLG